jgi:hypothetical protein
MNRTFTGVLSGIISVAAFTLCLASACKKSEKTCFNVQLQRDYMNVTCSTHCDGAIGCDGKTYCNACEAAKVGIYAN